MLKTIDWLTARYDQLGFDLVPTPGTDPQAWTAVDRFTGEVEDFSAQESNTNRWQDGHDTTRDRMFYFVAYFRSPSERRDHRIRYFAKQGKTIGETADALSLGWESIAYHRRRLGLPYKEPRGSRQAWNAQRNGSTNVHADDWAPFKALFDELEGFLPPDIQGLYRACQTNDGETIDQALTAHLAAHGEPEQQALAQLGDPLDAADGERWRKPVGDVDHRRHGIEPADGVAGYLALHEKWNSRL